MATEICRRIGTSSEGLRKICSDLGITTSVVYLWMMAHKEFMEQYAHAREMQCQVLADEITDIADSTEVGIIRTTGPRGEEVKEADMLEHRRLRVDARKWVLAKLVPKKYGDKLAVGGDARSPIQVVTNVQVARE